MPVTREMVAWGMRMLLGREPPDDATIEFHRQGHDTMDALRRAFLRAPQARSLFNEANKDTIPAYAIAPFLLRRPESASVPWRFEEPSLAAPVSQLCTFEQMQGGTYADLCARLGLDAGAPHRKTWEFAYILSALEAKGMVAAGRRGLGFGTGREPLPSVLAAAGVSVVATDAPSDNDQTSLWAGSAQWSDAVEHLWHPALVERDRFLAHTRFQPVNMNAIPGELRDFDFCWSACCLEHLGSIRHGLDFLRRCLDTLRPGGISLHTTEFNLGSNVQTMETPSLSLFRRQDIERVIEELVADGHTVEPLNLWPGASPVDEHLDLPPYGLPHLKLEVQGHQVTSLGLVVTKAG